MKSLVVYYSHYGNTAFVADKFFSVLNKRGEATIFELEYLQGRMNLFKQVLYRTMPALVNLAPAPFDLKDYDLLCLGVPVWAGYPPPLITKYLLLSKNLENKRIICCFVYSIEASAQKCYRYLKKLFQKKGIASITPIFISWVNAHNDLFLDKLISGALEQK